MSSSCVVQDTMASTAVSWLQRLGPRKARTRDTSIVKPLILLCSSGPAVAGLSLVADLIAVTARRCIESTQAGADQVCRQVQRPGGSHGCQHAVDLAGGSRFQQVQAQQHGFDAAFGQHDVVFAHEGCTAAGGQLFGNGGQCAVLSIQGHRAIAQVSQFQYLGIVGVEDGDAGRQHYVDLAAHHLVQGVSVQHVEILDAVEATHVRHHAHLAAVIGQAFGQYHARIAFKHGRLHAAVDQQALARIPVHAIAAGDAALVEEHAFAADGARVLARQAEQLGQQAHDQAGALRTRYANQWNAARFFLGKQMVDNRRADRARFAHARLDVGQQARAGVDFDDGAALLFQRTRDVGGDQVDAGDIQADYARSQQGRMHDRWVHVVGDVDGDVAVWLDQHFLASLRHGQGGHALAFQFQDDFARFMRFHHAQREVFAFATARIGIDLRVDQLQDVRDAIAIDPPGFALGRGDQLVADHQQAVFVARDEAFHQYGRAVALARRQVVGGFYVAFGHQVQRDATAMVAVVWLQYDGQAD